MNDFNWIYQHNATDNPLAASDPLFQQFNPAQLFQQISLL